MLIARPTDKQWEEFRVNCLGTQEDLDHLNRFAYAGNRRSAEEIYQSLRNCARTWLVQSEGKIVGVMTYGLGIPSQPNDLGLGIGRLFSRRGLGLAALKEFIGCQDENGIAIIHGFCNRNNVGMIQLMNRVGMIQDKDFRDPIDPDVLGFVLSQKARHQVSIRNRNQIFVKGLRLSRMYLEKGARVRVLHPERNVGAWEFTSDTDEVASLCHGNPAPPDWIQQGVTIDIEITPPLRRRTAVGPTTQSVKPTPRPAVEVRKGELVPPRFPEASDREKSDRGALQHKKTSVIYAVDIGSPRRGNLAWATIEDDDGSEAAGCSGRLNELCKRMSENLTAGRSVALGFEAPLFLPVRTDEMELLDGRTGEESAWSGRVAAPCIAYACAIAGHIMRRLTAMRPGNCRLEWRPDQWPERASTQGSAPLLVLWEAYVTKDPHAREGNVNGATEHLQDAATAALAFREWSADRKAYPRDGRISCGGDPTLSTIGAVALWSGWTSDLNILHEEVLVLSPKSRLGGDVTLMK